MVPGQPFVESALARTGRLPNLAGPAAVLFILLMTTACSHTGVGSEGASGSGGARDKPFAAASEIVPVEDGLRVDHAAAMERRLLRSVRYLASDELQGRGIGTRGIELAAKFIGDEFAKAGLRADHYADSPYQRFARSYRIAMNGPNQVSLRGPADDEQSLELRRDFTPISLSGTSQFELPVAFVGYGITAPEYDYDDYAEVDVSGAAVLILRHEPQQDAVDSPLAGTRITDHAYLHRKVANAVAHGASAVLFCTDQHALRKRATSGGGRQPTPPTNEDLDRHDTLLGFNVRGQVPSKRIPVVHLRRRAVEAMIDQSTGGDLGALEVSIDETLQPRSRMLDGWTVFGQISVGRISKDLKNVVATLEGSGPAAEETIVVGAHYDHLGVGGGWGSLEFGSRAVHNGADDNASGTAIVMELGRQLAGRKEPLGRRVLFIAFTAEESGLVGSEYYVARPLVPIEQTVAMLNFDMVGYLRKDRLEVHGTGTASDFDPLLYKWSTVHDLRLRKYSAGYGPSDHASFYQRGVPVLHFFTGFHDHYHRPSDDYEMLNIRGMRRITELARDLVIELANAAQRPRRRKSADDLLYAELFPSSRPRARRRTVTLGVEGGVDEGGAGFIVRRVAKWGLADRSGFRPGDRILEIGSRKVSSSTDYAEAVAELRDTNKVPVVVQRGGLELEIQMMID
jgi:hypothetical protein